MDNNIPQSTDLNSSQNLSPAVPTKPDLSFMKILLIIGLIIFILVVGLVSYILGQTPVKSTIPITPTITQTVQKACTLEAKICPDGTSVGRTGPNCEFAPCPNQVIPKDVLSPTLSLAANNNVNTSNIAQIEGTIEILSDNPKYMSLEDDIYVMISEKNSNEANYFGIPLCNMEKDDCIWKVSTVGNKKVFKYRLTRDGGTDYIRAGETYILSISDRIFNKDGNNGDVQSGKVTVSIPESNNLVKDFELKALFF